MLNLIVINSVSKSNRAVLTHLLSYVIKKNYFVLLHKIIASFIWTVGKIKTGLKTIFIDSKLIY